MIYTMNYNSELGKILIASDGNSIIGLWIKGQKYFLSGIKEELIQNDNLEIFRQTRIWLDKYFKGEKVSPNELNLNPTGSKFRQEVWKILCEIPYGKTTTYKRISEKIARMEGKKKMSAQAVGGAIGHNPISIIIPCHRVIGNNGNLTGYAGGIEKKIRLLEIERVDIANFYM